MRAAGDMQERASLRPPFGFLGKKYPLQKRDQSYHTTAAVTMQEKILPEGKFCHIL